MTAPQERSVLIVGAGVFGTSTAYHLAKKYKDPFRITVVDRHPTPPYLAASTDINKIIRADYSSAFYANLAYEAIEQWTQWPELSPFYHRTGWVMLDFRGSDLAARIRAVFRERGHDPTEDVRLDQLDSRWKGILKGTDLSNVESAYWNPEAGWCEAAAATASLMKAAQDLGVRYVTADVESLLLDSHGVRGVVTESGEHLLAEQTVLATGAWTSSLLVKTEDELGIPPEDRVERQAQTAGVAVAHYKMSDAEMEQLSEMPVVVYGESGEVIPPPAGNRLLKFTNANTFTNIVGTSSGQRISVPPDRPQNIVSDRLKNAMAAAMTDNIMQSFTQGKKVDHWRICWDDRTPTQDWLLSPHPDRRIGNLFFAIGGSFHSYKFLPNVGKYMANVLDGTGNGAEADRAWGWKDSSTNWRGAHEKTAPKTDLQDML